MEESTVDTGYEPRTTGAGGRTRSGEPTDGGKETYIG